MTYKVEQEVGPWFCDHCNLDQTMIYNALDESYTCVVCRWWFRQWDAMQAPRDNQKKVKGRDDA
jgi:hypothetical protein